MEEEASQEEVSLGVAKATVIEGGSEPEEDNLLLSSAFDIDG